MTPPDLRDVRARIRSTTWARALGVAIAGAVVGPGCAARPTTVTLVSIDGTPAAPEAVLHGADFTVFVFVARSCPCVAAHDARLRELAEAFAPRGVRVVAVFSEVGETAATAAAERARRGYPFSALVDEGGVFAEQLGAEYAAYSVIMSRGGQVLYRGGIDSDKTTLHGDAAMYLRDALTDLTEGRAPRRSEGEALGCVLRRR
jgi:hypothetical protein